MSELADDAPLTHTAAPNPSIVPLALGFEGGLAVLAMVVGWLLAVPPWKQIAWSWTAVGWGIAATGPMFVVLWAMRQFPGGPIGELNSVVDRALVPLFVRVPAWQLGLVALAAGIGEELLFRGVLQPLVCDWLGVPLGVVVASAVFGLAHLITPLYALLATVVGVYLGWLAVAFGNLLPPIIAHSLYDFLALLYLTRTSHWNAKS